MNAPIRPITARDPVCYGVCCPMHSNCSRYHAVDGHAGPSAPIATCDDGHGAHPLFLPAAKALQGLAAQPLATCG